MSHVRQFMLRVSRHSRQLLTTSASPEHSVYTSYPLPLSPKLKQSLFKTRHLQ
jgi:hypothetical protein